MFFVFGIIFFNKVKKLLRRKARKVLHGTKWLFLLLLSLTFLLLDLLSLLSLALSNYVFDVLHNLFFVILRNIFSPHEFLCNFQNTIPVVIWDSHHFTLIQLNPKDRIVASLFEEPISFIIGLIRLLNHFPKFVPLLSIEVINIKNSVFVKNLIGVRFDLHFAHFRNVFVFNLTLQLLQLYLFLLLVYLF